MPSGPSTGYFKAEMGAGRSCFSFLEPEKYYEVARKVAANRAQREKDIQQALDILQARFNETKLKAETYGRPKHLYSIYQKMQKKRWNLKKSMT